jgi:hypothetical protein
MSPRQRRGFFKLATPQQMRVFEEACYNLVKNKTKKYGGTIKVLALRGNSIKRKRIILSQKGGFLGALLPILASIVTSFIKT